MDLKNQQKNTGPKYQNQNLPFFDVHFNAFLMEQMTTTCEFKFFVLSKQWVHANWTIHG